MRPLLGLLPLPLGLAAALPAGAQVSTAVAQQRAETLTVSLSPPAGGSMVRFYIERTAGNVAVVAPEMSLPASSRSVRGLLQARGPVRLLVAPGVVGLRLRSVDPTENLHVVHQGRDSLGAVFFTAEGRSITFVRGSGEPGLRVFADRMQTRRTP